MIFRTNIKGGTALGNKASVYINKGDPVPNETTIPMIINRLQEDDCKNGRMLDGFPRNITQAEALDKALKERDIKLDYVIEIVLGREISQKRIMGRRLCPVDTNHPNNIHIDAIKPAMVNGNMVCMVCGAENLTVRSDDQNEAAINKRHDIYYDTKTGTMSAVNYFRERVKIIGVDGRPSVGEVSKMLMENLP